MIRRPIFAANWKMNHGPSETEDFANSLLPEIQHKAFSCDIVIAPPAISLAKAAELFGGVSAIELAAQNCSQHDAGAYTGEISVMMLKEYFVHYVILGHSERRTIFGETDEVINAKVRKSLELNMKPILCIGETLEQRENGKLEEVLRGQIRDSLDGLKAEDFTEVVIAYEPIWAIGTGVTATAEQAQEAHAFVRSLISEKFGTEAASRVRIQYGGSVKPDNAAELMACPDIDGALIGGASLVAESFLTVIKNGLGE